MSARGNARIVVDLAFTACGRVLRGLSFTLQRNGCAERAAEANGYREHRHADGDLALLGAAIGGPAVQHFQSVPGSHSRTVGPSGERFG